MRLIKDILGFFQIVLVTVALISAVQYFFKDFVILRSVEPLNQSWLAFISGIINPVIGGIDCSVLFIIVPYFLLSILISYLINILDPRKEKTFAFNRSVLAQRNFEIAEKVKEKQKDELQKKQAVYLVIELVFSKFTISSLSEDEIAEKIDEIKEHLFGDVVSFRGKLLEDSEFDDENTIAILFYSQDDALNFLYRFKESVVIVDDDIQAFGFSLGFKAILDSQLTEAIKYYILEFLEKALRTVELNEISTTNDFADRYKAFGGSKQVSFTSKGTYSINKSRVELNSLTY